MLVSLLSMPDSSTPTGMMMSSFQNSSNFRILGSQLTDIGRDQINNIHNYPASAHRNVSESPTHLSVSDSLVYSRQLLLKQHGFPLWVPEPYGHSGVYRTKGVRIGDVGYVTEFGAFVTLFNIRAPADHPINRDGVPDGFEQVHLGAEPADCLSYFHQQDSAITSKSARKVTFSPGATNENQLISAGSDVGSVFTWSTSEGAILHLPYGASRLECRRPGILRDEAAKHGRNWYKFANNTLRCDISNGSLYLITGTDKAKSWMVGAFSEAESEISLKVSRVAISYSYSWATSTPHRTTPPVDATDDIDQNEADAVERDDILFRGDAPGGRTHSVFVRGYRIKLRRGLMDSLTGTPVVQISSVHNSSPRDLIGGRTSSFQAGSSSRWSRWGAEGRASSRSCQRRIENLKVPAQADHPDQKENVVIEYMPKPSEPHHPSTLINDILLENMPEAQIAITHDNQWCALIREDDTEFPVRSELISRIREKYIIVIVSGCVSLVPRQQDARRLSSTAEEKRLGTINPLSIKAGSDAKTPISNMHLPLHMLLTPPKTTSETELHQAREVASRVMDAVQIRDARGNIDGFSVLAYDACALVFSAAEIATKVRLADGLLKTLVRQLEEIEGFVLKRRSLLRRIMKSTSTLDRQRIADYRRKLASFQLMPMKAQVDSCNLREFS